MVAWESLNVALRWWNGILWWQFSYLRSLVSDDYRKVFLAWRVEVLCQGSGLGRDSSRDKCVCESALSPLRSSQRTMETVLVRRGVALAVAEFSSAAVSATNSEMSSVE